MNYWVLCLMVFSLVRVFILSPMQQVYMVAHKKNHVRNHKRSMKRGREFFKQTRLHRAEYIKLAKLMTASMQEKTDQIQENMVCIESDTQEVVRGDLVLVPGGLKFFYTSPELESRERSLMVRVIHETAIDENLPTKDMTLTTLYDLEGNALAIKPDDIIATVFIRSKDCEQWGRYNHPQLGEFPLYLPCSLLEGKKEEDIVSFLFQKIGTEKRFTVELTCKQQSGFYYPAENFEDTFAQALGYLKKFCIRVEKKPAVVEKKEAPRNTNFLFTAQEQETRDSLFDVLKAFFRR